MTPEEIVESFQTEEGLTRNWNCASFLEPPADAVVRAAITEIRRQKERGSKAADQYSNEASHHDTLLAENADLKQQVQRLEGELEEEGWKKRMAEDLAKNTRWSLNASEEARESLRKYAEKCEELYNRERKRLMEILALESPYPLSGVLEHLVHAVEHLMKEHDCDTHGWEIWNRAAQEGKKLLGIIRGQ